MVNPDNETTRETLRLEKLHSAEAKLLAREKVRTKAYLVREQEIEKVQKQKEDQRALERVSQEIKDQSKEKARREAYVAREEKIAANLAARLDMHKKPKPD